MEAQVLATHVREEHTVRPEHQVVQNVQVDIQVRLEHHLVTNAQVHQEVANNITEKSRYLYDTNEKMIQ